LRTNFHLRTPGINLAALAAADHQHSIKIKARPKAMVATGRPQLPLEKERAVILNQRPRSATTRCFTPALRHELCTASKAAQSKLGDSAASKKWWWRAVFADGLSVMLYLKHCFKRSHPSSPRKPLFPGHRAPPSRWCRIFVQVFVDWGLEN